MDEPVIEQALYGSDDASGYRILAKSGGFHDDWLPEAERLCAAFGERPAGAACPACLFVQPFGPRHVAVVQVADHGADDAGRPGTLRFRLLIVPRTLYAALDNDPFLLADAFPPPKEAESPLPPLKWTAGAAPPRTVATLRKVLDVPHTATLLGAAQALIDGGRVAFTRSQPDAKVIRDLWTLLPSGSRGELWPATFAFGNIEAYHVVAVPAALAPTDPRWIHEDQAGDYPEGRYELNLQIAVETGDQRELDSLLARRTRTQMIYFAAALLAAMILGISLVPLALHFYRPAPAPEQATSPPAPALELPPEKECPPLDAAERARLAVKLQELGKRIDLDLPAGSSDQDLTDALARIDDKLGAPATERDPGPLRQFGAIQRQLRALLWKHGVEAYNKPGLNTAELADRLEQHLVKERRP
jgi:hypothetical protein